MLVKSKDAKDHVMYFKGDVHNFEKIPDKA